MRSRMPELLERALTHSSLAFEQGAAAADALITNNLSFWAMRSWG